MKHLCKNAAFFAFTVVFAVLAIFVFWGTWSLDMVPVMPDSAMVHSPYWFEDWWRNWAQTGKFVPGDLRVFLGSPYFWQELNYVIGPYFAALALVYFLRGRGLSSLSSYSAGLLLAFCGYWFTLFSAGHGSWFTWMTYGLFPFGLLDRAITKGKLKNWILLGATLGWASYWQTDLWLLFTSFTGVYFIFRCILEKKFPWKGMLAAGAVMFIVGGSGFYSALTKDLAGRDRQIAEGQTVADPESKSHDDKRWIFTTNWSLPPSEVLEFFVPRINGDTSCQLTLMAGAKYRTGVMPYTGALGRPHGAKTGNYRQHSLYVGWVTCLFALIGVAGAFLKRDKTALFFFVCGVVFCIFSFGRYCEIVYRCVYALPFGDYLRAPVKWHHLTEFCIAVLAGFGIEFVIGCFVKSAAWMRIVKFAVLLAFVLVGAISLARNARFYCAPLNISEARRQNAGMQMTFVRQSDLQNPQVRALINAKRLVLLSEANREYVLAGIIQPIRKNKDPFPPLSVYAWLSVLSMAASLGVGIYVVKKT